MRISYKQLITGEFDEAKLNVFLFRMFQKGCNFAGRHAGGPWSTTSSRRLGTEKLQRRTHTLMLPSIFQDPSKSLTNGPTLVVLSSAKSTSRVRRESCEKLWSKTDGHCKIMSIKKCDNEKAQIVRIITDL